MEASLWCQAVRSERPRPTGLPPPPPPPAPPARATPAPGGAAPRPEAGSATALGGGIAYVDPRLPDLGVRLMLPRTSAHATLAALNATEDADGAAYHQRRIALGVPDAAQDLTPEKSILLENGFDELNAIDWQKGCYMGQELTARTRYRGLVRKRLLPVAIEGPAPVAGTPLLLGDKELGEIVAVRGDDPAAVGGLSFERQRDLVGAPRGGGALDVEAGRREARHHVGSHAGRIRERLEIEQIPVLGLIDERARQRGAGAVFPPRRRQDVQRGGTRSGVSHQAELADLQQGDLGGAAIQRREHHELAVDSPAQHVELGA